MDYAIEIQIIIDALKTDQAANPKWRNKVVARLEELQPWCLMFYEQPSFSDPMPGGAIDPPQASPTDLSAIPPSLREFANPNQIRGDQAPEEPA